MNNEIVHWVNFLYTLDLSETYQHIRIDKTCDDVQNQLSSETITLHSTLYIYINIYGKNLVGCKNLCSNHLYIPIDY